MRRRRRTPSSSRLSGCSVGDHKRNGKKAVNRHQTQSKASAGAQERAIERKERQRAKKLVASTKHEFPIVPFDGKPADFCIVCGAFKRALNYDPACWGSRKERLAQAQVEARSVTITDEWGHTKVVGGFGDVGGKKTEEKGRRQCAKCPWRKDVDPRDIPDGYCEVKHANLKSTIAEPGSVRGLLGGDPLRVMACHEFPVSAEQPCVGWVIHQLGPGNNIALRMQALDGRFKNWRTVGEQHETFEDTLPK